MGFTVIMRMVTHTMTDSKMRGSSTRNPPLTSQIGSSPPRGIFRGMLPRAARPSLRRLIPWLLATAALLVLSPPFLVAEEADKSTIAVHASDSRFEDVMDGLRLAIEERGLFINNIMHMNEMLERTGADLGADQPLFGQAQSVEFCSAVLSRRMIAEAPERIVNCPFIIAVYTLPDDPDQTYVAHRRFPAEELASSEAMREVATLLEAIAEQALSW